MAAGLPAACKSHDFSKNAARCQTGRGIFFGYVPGRRGDAPGVTFNMVSEKRMRPASTIQRHPG